MPALHLVQEIRLCRGVYKPTCDDLPPVEVICQAVVLNSVAYIWIDGVDAENPLLLPAQHLHNFRSLGTLREYLSNERHMDLEEGFDDLMDICMAQKESATTMVRALEIMHTEGLPADQAVTTARQWGILLNELDQAERASYQLVSSGRMPGAASMSTLVH
jgi:hypothetical protein